MLEIGVHHNRRRAPRMAQTGVERGLMAEIAREREIAHRDIVGRRGAQRGERAVAAAIVDENDLVAAERGQFGLEGRAHRRDIVRFVVRGQHDRKLGSGVTH